MSPQSPSRFFKRIRLYCERNKSTRDLVPEGTRGLYVLYKKRSESSKLFDVTYIGVGGTGKKSGLGARIWTHKNDGKNPDWTHYSVFEVHDNISAEEILELEKFLLHVFRSDSRLINVRFGSSTFKQLSTKRLWSK